MTGKAPEELGRRSIRLKGYDYTQVGGYYITIVSSGRENLFGDVVEGRMVLNRFGQIAKTQWERLPHRFRHIEMGEFVVMPNHIHGIIYIVDGMGTAMNGRGTAMGGRGTALDGGVTPLGGRGTAEGFEANDDELTRRAPTDDSSTHRGGTAEGFEANDDGSTRRAPTDDGSTRRAPTEQFGKPISGSIPTIIRSYKSAVALRVNLSRQTRDIPVWQRNYYEHIIRSQADDERIAGYIFDNPFNWGQDMENPAGKGNAPR